MKSAILIPAYCPEQSLVKTATRLVDLGIGDLMIVDDGSGPAYHEIFEELRLCGCHVAVHEVNRGKGAAIRTGITSLLALDPDLDCIITADADGQHRPVDIVRICDEASSKNGAFAPLILGTRDFSGDQVPRRSRFGNRFSSFYFKCSTGKICPDTQTGLRAIPRRLFRLALDTPGDRYDYEMNFLMAAARETPADAGPSFEPLAFVPIAAVYEEKNRSSHFRPIVDSFRVYKTPLKYICASLISAAVDLTIFTILAKMGQAAASGIFLATVGARVISGIVNFSLNRRWSFSANRAVQGSAGKQGIRYFTLFISQMLASWALVTAFSFLPLSLTGVKVIVDTLLAVVSFFMQQNWVFRRDRKTGTAQSRTRTPSGTVQAVIR